MHADGGFADQAIGAEIATDRGRDLVAIDDDSEVANSEAEMKWPVAARAALRQHDIRDDGAGQPAAIGKGKVRVRTAARRVQSLAVRQPWGRRGTVGIDRHLSAPEHRTAIGEFEQCLAPVGVVPTGFRRIEGVVDRLGILRAVFSVRKIHAPQERERCRRRGEDHGSVAQ
jgi:hypothetical protein